jgi:hypothetical protein
MCPQFNLAFSRKLSCPISLELSTALGILRWFGAPQNAVVLRYDIDVVTRQFPKLDPYALFRSMPDLTFQQHGLILCGKLQYEVDFIIGFESGGSFSVNEGPQHTEVCNPIFS